MIEARRLFFILSSDIWPMSIVLVIDVLDQQYPVIEKTIEKLQAKVEFKQEGPANVDPDSKAFTFTVATLALPWDLPLPPPLDSCCGPDPGTQS